MTLPDELKARLKRFYIYLAEADAQGILEGYDHLSFTRLRRKIHDVAHVWTYQKQPATGLNYKNAEKFSKQLGHDLMLFAEQEYWKFTEKKYDWHTLVDLADLVKLGWAIMYYGE